MVELLSPVHFMCGLRAKLSVFVLIVCFMYDFERFAPKWYTNAGFCPLAHAGLAPNDVSRLMRRTSSHSRNMCAVDFDTRHCIFPEQPRQ